MPTVQEMMIARLVGDMKQAVKRKADESDSEHSIDQTTNRGNKLKKRARYVREGRLAMPNGPQAYKKTITYNEHYERTIISERPMLYDEDGYEMDSEDDEDGEALAAANEFYPYNDVRMEELLAPLTSVTDLPNHPTLSRPFTSKTLTELTLNARSMMQKEKETLWKMKRLLTRLSGDHIWVPTALLETPNDISFFGDGRNEYREHLLEKNRLEDARSEDTDMNGAILAQLDAGTPGQAVDNSATENEIAMVDVPTQNGSAQEVKTSTSIEPAVAEDVAAATNGDTNTTELDADKKAAGPHESENEQNANETDKMDGVVTDGELKAAATTDAEESAEDKANQFEDPDTTLPDPDVPADDESEEKDETDAPEPRRMRTRAQAQAASDDNVRSRTRSLSTSSNDSFIHPFFLAPQSAIPDRDIGLPTQEADETRRLLQLFVQKQEEVCRGSEKLYAGLLKADRLRSDVMKWAKAEAHTGENGMSDGEDWYDMEEWNLDEELKKGQDEDDEDAATTAKKTRTRRQ
ncbi:hypothetical protein VE00_08744 [Pseudogymnoascus sp. WSF 3629]|nr:hypothetical protein VE00_08744 [Pseudogymnoascus sp. WSF 3629]